jgi:hypothetical protein
VVGVAAVVVVVMVAAAKSGMFVVSEEAHTDTLPGARPPAKAVRSPCANSRF